MTEVSTVEWVARSTATFECSRALLAPRGVPTCLMPQIKESGKAHRLPDVQNISSLRPCLGPFSRLNAQSFNAVNAVKPSHVKNGYPGYMEQAPSMGHDASPQSGLGVDCMRCSSSKKIIAWAKCTCASAAHKHSHLIPSCGVFPVLVSFAQRNKARRV